MRILLVSHGFPPAAGGGAEIYAHAHASELARTGDDVLVIAREADAQRAEYAVRREQQSGFSVAWINNTFASVSSFEDSYRNVRVGEIAARLIQDFSPDVAHIHHLTCLSTTIVDTLKSQGVPVFFTLHDYWLLCHRGQLLDVNLKVCNGPANGCGACLGPAATLPASAYAARSALARIGGVLPSAALPTLRRLAGQLGSVAGADRRAAASNARMKEMRAVTDGVTHFFAPSRCMRDRFVESGIDAGRISISEYGVEPRTAGLPSRLETLGPGDRPLRVGFLGSLMVSKAPHLLIEACADLPSGAVTVDLWGDPAAYHGDDRYRSQLRSWLDRPGVRTHGRIEHGQVPSALARIDVLAVPSIWPENSPLVIREAFSAGVPVVAARIGGIPETVEDNVSGLLFEPGQAQDLRRVLLRLLNEPDLLPRLQRGIPSVRTLTDDVASMRERYVQARVTRPRRSRLAAVVLNFRTPGDTFLATRSLLHSARVPDDVIVVDNDSSPAGAEALEAIRSRVTYIRTGVNLGFSGGMNAGIEQALARGADRVLLVNSDVIVAPDCIGRLELALDATSSTGRVVGVAGPVVLARHAPDRVVSAGMNYNARTGRMRHRGVGTSTTNSVTGFAGTVAAVSGSVMLVTRETFETVGLLDPDYFYSFEDLDFCLRARAAGFTSVIVGGAVAFHEGSQSIGARSTRRLYFGARNHLLLSHRSSTGRSAAGRAGRAIFIVGLNLAHAAARAPGGTLISRVGAVLRGTRDYMTGRFGDDSAVRVDPASGS